MKVRAAAQQLDGFLAKYSPEIRTFARTALAKLRSRLPGAVQMVYDNYNGLVIGFGPNERPSEAIFSLVLFPRWVTLCFLQGARLADPNKLLKGSGKVVRHIRLEDPDDFDKPAIEDLIARALKSARVPIDGKAKGLLIIKSISAKQRPRRPIK